MKNLAKRVSEIQTLIEKAIVDDVDAIECDSTWESMYQFKKIELLKTRLKVSYQEWDGIKSKEVVDVVDLRSDARIEYQDTKYMLSWIKRCINKGYRESYQASQCETTYFE
jgi:hypothetical protein